MLICVYVFKTPCEKYAFSLGKTFRLYNESSLAIEIVSEIRHLIRKHPSLREEVIFLSMNFGHPL
jgi:hypothetical protein